MKLFLYFEHGHPQGEEGGQLPPHNLEEHQFGRSSHLTTYMYYNVSLHLHTMGHHGPNGAYAYNFETAKSLKWNTWISSSESSPFAR